MKNLIAVALACLLFALPVQAAKALTIFLNVPSITGENPVPGFPGAMAVQSLTLSPNGYSVVKNVDSTSPAIFNAVAAGTPLNTSTLLIYASAPTASPDVSLSFPNTFATSFQNLGATERDSFASTVYGSLFLQLAGVTGESSTPGHPGVIRLDAFTLTSSSFSILKPIDSTSPVLFNDVASGTPISTASLLLYNSSTPGPQPDRVITFNTSFATAYQVINTQDQTTFAFTSIPEPASLSLLALATPLLLTRTKAAAAAQAFSPRQAGRSPRRRG